MLKELKKVKDKVEFILENYPNTKNSDKSLLSAYYIEFCKPSDSIVDFIFNTPIKSIYRARRALKDKYPRSKDSEKAHQEECDKVTEYYRGYGG